MLTIVSSRATMSLVNTLSVPVLSPSKPPLIRTSVTLQHPYLAVHGHCGKWFLCEKIYRSDLITWKVIYNATAGVPSNDYSVDTCYPVLLNVMTLVDTNFRVPFIITVV